MHRPKLLLIHGLVGSLDYFGPEKRFSKATVRTCDLLGYGERRNVDLGRVTLQSQADHVSGVIGALAGAPVWLLGHSMGGAMAMLTADRHPDLVGGIINVEGNFTLKDAFWSSRIAAKDPNQWADEYRAMQEDVPGWLRRCGLEPTAERLEWARLILAHQPAETVQKMSQAIVNETRRPDYPAALRRVIERGVPVHLIAGEKSADAWDLPDLVRGAARSYVKQPGVGHLMMLEDPDGFCRIVDSLFDLRA